MHCLCTQKHQKREEDPLKVDKFKKGGGCQKDCGVFKNYCKAKINYDKSFSGTDHKKFFAPILIARPKVNDLGENTTIDCPKR